MFCEKIKTAGMDKEAWLRLRKTGIGGSDAGAVCGLDPYRNSMSVYRDKTGEENGAEDSEAVRIGHDLEDYVARRFMEAAGKKVCRSNYMYRGIEHPFMIADVDRLVVGEDAGLECKTANAYQSDKWKDGDIPLHYVLQCYHYMAVTGKRAWYIAAVILGREFVWRKLEWDDALIGQLISMESDFWDGHVKPRIMPAPDGSDICDEVLAGYFGTARKGSTVELAGFDGKLERRAEILSRMESLKKEQKQIEQEIKLYMQDNERAASGKYRVTWNSVETARLDTARIKEECPDIYRKYVKVSTSRRFRVKVVS